MVVLKQDLFFFYLLFQIGVITAQTFAVEKIAVGKCDLYVIYLLLLLILL